ncbi:hypothetical protein VOLCADRAFT_91117 [Volvox carteri f. nagariensis]|uniref:Uncharacterized protein n=1 Tax=Volvox carteri f. nagariensis TaxID=3068 RepID=D8TW81_VOLCA|nr:uncharacterized protein VOLCADRAFT_91117 [Volvox carteri f. nagariensis]EFJ48327.1 hypothetical protein VOLCADRAFT_91117 [Volvox carteri f. nagariensis]|eukprot:XP_002950581.1 hypothetical protein VOLCADRAFT_91117 [Volvox carteri f. nagariensis]
MGRTAAIAAALLLPLLLASTAVAQTFQQQWCNIPSYNSSPACTPRLTSCTTVDQYYGRNDPRFDICMIPGYWNASGSAWPYAKPGVIGALDDLHAFNLRRSKCSFSRMTPAVCGRAVTSRGLASPLRAITVNVLEQTLPKTCAHISFYRSTKELRQSQFTAVPAQQAGAAA